MLLLALLYYLISIEVNCVQQPGYVSIATKDSYKDAYYFYCGSCYSSFHKASATCLDCYASRFEDIPLDDESLLRYMNLTDPLWRPLEWCSNFGTNLNSICLKSPSSSTNSTFNCVKETLKLRNPLFLMSDSCISWHPMNRSFISQTKCSLKLNFLCFSYPKEFEPFSCSTQEYCNSENYFDVLLTEKCPLIRNSLRLGREVFTGGRIVHGRESSIERNPWLVRFEIFYEDRGYDTCAGSILSPHAILTAKHCVDGIQSEMSIYFGEAKIDSQIKDQKQNGMQARHREITNAHFYALDGQDLAIVVVEEALYNYTTDRVAPIKLSNLGGPVVKEKDVARVAGWGSTCAEDDSTCSHTTVAVTLNEIELEVVESYEKWYIFDLRNTKCPYNSKMTPMMFCASGVNKSHQDTCKGDSGAPLICSTPNNTEYACGLTSFGPRQCGSSAGGYVNLTHPVILQFFEFTMANLSARIAAGFCDKNYDETISYATTVHTLLIHLFVILILRQSFS